MNYGINQEPPVLPEYNLKYIDQHGLYYYTSKLYLAYFGRLGSIYIFPDLDISRFLENFPQEFDSEILGQHFKKYLGQKEEVGQQIYILREDILINITTDSVIVYFVNRDGPLLKKLRELLLSFRTEKPDMAQINLITISNGDFENRKIDFKKPKLDFKKMYNEDFIFFHKKIMTHLEQKASSGLHLLYGKPGTGKSTYIRYLCGKVDKRVIFISGQMARNLDNVSMTRYLIYNADSILVIEDAEELIISRDNQRNSNLAMILNITDGILGESLGIQIIATFNTDVQNIDPALKRKGRLKSAFEFKALSPEKANTLLREQNMTYSTEEEMTLAEIYTISEEEQYKSPARKAVGFK